MATNVSVPNSYNEVNDSKLEIVLMQLDLEQFLHDDVPAFILLLVLGVFGVLGNANALKVFKYFPVNSVTILVRSMMIIDLMATGINIPLEIVQLRYTITYPSRTLCKMTRYLIHFGTLTSGLLLVSVAIERRRKICSSHKTLSVKRTKQLISAFIALSACLSIFAAVYYDVSNKDLTNKDMVGKECTDPKNFWERTVYAITVASIIMVSFTVCVIAYIQIVNVIRKQIRQEKEWDNEKPPLTGSKEEYNNISYLQNRKTRKHQYRNSRKLTIILLIGTGVSFVGYFMHVSAHVIKILLTKDTFVDVTSVYEFLLRCYFLHSAVHPVVFCIVDHRFREYLRQIYSSLANRFKTSENSLSNIELTNRTAIK